MSHERMPIRVFAAGVSAGCGRIRDLFLELEDGLLKMALGDQRSLVHVTLRKLLNPLV